MLLPDVNDYYVFYDEATPKHISKDAYELLKAEGYGYRESCLTGELNSNTIIVPFLFSMWAVSNNVHPATRFNIDREEEDSYFGRAGDLKKKGLEDSVELVWNSIPRYDRDFMVSMFLSRPALLNVDVHITPDC